MDLNTLKATVDSLNTKVGKLNVQRLQNIGRKGQLEDQLAEQIAKYKEKYGTELTAENIDAEIAKEEAAKIKEVEQLTAVITAVEKGEYSRAYALLGQEYTPETILSANNGVQSFAEKQEEIMNRNFNAIPNTAPTVAPDTAPTVENVATNTAPVVKNTAPTQTPVETPQSASKPSVAVTKSISNMSALANSATAETSKTTGGFNFANPEESTPPVQVNAVPNVANKAPVSPAPSAVEEVPPTVSKPKLAPPDIDDAPPVVKSKTHIAPPDMEEPPAVAPKTHTTLPDMEEPPTLSSKVQKPDTTGNSLFSDLNISTPSIASNASKFEALFGSSSFTSK